MSKYKVTNKTEAVIHMKFLDENGKKNLVFGPKESAEVELPYEAIGQMPEGWKENFEIEKVVESSYAGSRKRRSSNEENGD